MSTYNPTFRGTQNPDTPDLPFGQVATTGYQGISYSIQPDRAPYPLFQQSSGNSTIDDNVTFDKTREFLDHYIETHGDELGRRGVYKCD